MDCSAKILLLGKTGAGKSSFINYFLGKEIAKTGKGKPVTMDYFVPYEVKDGRYPIKIYDTRGLETLGAYAQLTKIINGIKKKNNNDDIFDWFHTIFYCVSMTTHFEDFEVNFIRRLQRELTQNIHIILTHCDACKEDNIRHMREKILSSLEHKDNIEIFEVICVSKKKRNGTIVYPHGKEVISERVFDLLLKDIAYKVSSDYAIALNSALTDVAIKTRLKFEQLIDDVVNLKTLIAAIKDIDEADNQLNTYFDTVTDELEKEFKSVQEYTDQRFNKILQPVIQLYISYKSVVTNTFIDDMKLNFEDILEWSCEDWIKSNKYLNDEEFFMRKVFPRLTKKGYLDDSFNGDTFGEILEAIVTGIKDFWNIKERLKKICREIYSDFASSIPQTAEFQQEAYKRIVNFMTQL